MFLQRHLARAPKKLKAAVAENSGLVMFILGRHAAVSCLRGDINQLDPTDGRALDSVL